MRSTTKVLILIVFTFSLSTGISQEDTTRQGEDFQYLFNQKKKKKDREPKEISDTLSLADFYDMSLEELEDLKATGVSSELEKYINSLISVSTQKSLPSRYSPNIVTLVTEEEIKSMGARDLIEVLQLVPGFHFAQDNKGNVGLGIRGNWAAEGKVLIMINGKEINEHYTAHTYFGNHFPVDMIKRIEIVRGPGSAIYGGLAEFGVINIVTKKPNDLNGLEFVLNQGQMGEGVGRGKFNFYVGKKWERSDLNFWFAAGNSQRSNRQHYGFYDCSIDSIICQDSIGVGAYASLAGESDIDNFMSNFEFNSGGFSVSSLLDYYGVTDVTVLDSRKRRPVKRGYFSSYNEIKQRFRITPKLTITPKINFNIQTPVEENTPYAEALINHPEFADSLAIATTRFRARVDINYNLNHRINMLGGFDFYNDFALNADTISQFYSGEPPDQYSSTAFYGEMIFKLPVFHLFAGARFETNAAYNSAFSPRIGITKKFNKFHLKFLVTDAYRLPTLGNIYYSFDGTYDVAPDSSYVYNVGRGLNPEKTLVLEAEAGYQFSEKTFLTLNIFDMTIRDPIVYTFFQDETIRDIYGYNSGLYVYQNFNKSGTRGFELDFRFQDKWGFLNANYSYYSVSSKPKISAYTVSTFNRDPRERELVDDDVLLAFPQHRLNLNWLYYITEDFSVNLNSSFIGSTYGYDISIIGPGPWDVDGKLIKNRFTYLVNFYFRYQNLFTKGLAAGLGVNDVFNKGTSYMQPYFGVQPPLPGASREFKFIIEYKLPFKNKKRNN
ncbi:MAG: TonB-dependent receptor plug domain-containing protein [Bacteroidetes bacterium]|nr:TonB-dependent receptor plug domain-containing protein [Bacteroidota bacterium]